MAQVINTNVSALFAGGALNKSANSLQVAQARLSSGVRINSVADDPTGLRIATNYDREIRGTNAAIRNANDAVSRAQTLDGYAQQINTNLQRMYEIFVQTKDTVTDETTALAAENTRISGLISADTLLVGGKTVTVDGDGTTVAAQSNKLSDDANFGGMTTAATVKTAIDTLATDRAKFGADIATYSSAVSTMQISSVNVSAAFSRVMDTDYAIETAQMARNNILQQAGTSMLAQANQTPQSVLGLLR